VVGSQDTSSSQKNSRTLQSRVGSERPNGKKKQPTRIQNNRGESVSSKNGGGETSKSTFNDGEGSGKSRGETPTKSIAKRRKRSFCEGKAESLPRS